MQALLLEHTAKLCSFLVFVGISVFVSFSLVNIHYECPWFLSPYHRPISSSFLNERLRILGPELTRSTILCTLSATISVGGMHIAACSRFCCDSTFFRYVWTVYTGSLSIARILFFCFNSESRVIFVSIVVAVLVFAGIGFGDWVPMTSYVRLSAQISSSITNCS